MGQFAANVLQHFHLLLGFDALCNHFQTKTMSQHDNDTNDFVGFQVAVHAGDESSVDLQSVDGESLQAAKGRVTGTEVVNAKTSAKGFQLGEHDRGMADVGHSDGLGYFQVETARIHPGLPEGSVRSRKQGQAERTAWG